MAKPYEKESVNKKAWMQQQVAKLGARWARRHGAPVGPVAATIHGPGPNRVKLLNKRIERFNKKMHRKQAELLEAIG